MTTTIMDSNITPDVDNSPTQPKMNLHTFLTYLSTGAPTTFTYLLSLLPNPTLKSLRLIHKPLSPILFPHLFHRIYISCHTLDLTTFRLIATHPSLAAHHVRELIWDDTVFDTWISGLQSYTDRLSTTTTIPLHILKSDAATVAEAYTFWSTQSRDFSSNRADNLDHKFFAEYIGHFPNLQRICILSRSRLTYVDPAVYWSLWAQTPRTRFWRSQERFARYLVQPEPFKPSTGTTSADSEGMRAMRIVRQTVREWPERLRVGGLGIKSIGGGQSRSREGNMVGAGRYERTWHIDLGELLEGGRKGLGGMWKGGGGRKRGALGTSGKNKVALELFLETQTEDIFRNAGMLEDSLDLLMMDVAGSLEHLVISNICLDWFMDYSTLVNTQFPYLQRLKSVRIQGGSSDSPVELLHFLAKHTSVREVAFDGLHLEAVAWSEVLHDLRNNDIVFDAFELRPSRAKAQIFPHPVDSWVLPRIVFSDKIVPWLKRETDVFPLLCAD